MNRNVLGTLLLIAMSGSSASALDLGAKVKAIHVVPDGNEVRIEVELTAPVKPTVRELNNPSRLIVDFPQLFVGDQSQRLKLYRSGVYEVHVSSRATDLAATRIVAGIDSMRPYSIQFHANTVVVSILPHPDAGAATATATNLRAVTPTKAPPVMNIAESVTSTNLVPQVESVPLESTIELPAAEHTEPARRSFKVKYISGDTIYLDGGSNSGIRSGMELDINRHQAVATGGAPANGQDAFVASVRVIGVAAASAVTELLTQDRNIHVGDVAELTPKDATAAAGNALNASRGETKSVVQPVNDETGSSSSTAGTESHFVQSQQRPEIVEGTGMAGRITFDSSAITSYGSTPGTTMQKGVSIQSDMTHILGTHWNLQGYWRGRINRHSQFQEPTIEESLNKTYTMQLYYDNPDSKWVAGVGRLYLPWAASLDTIDGGYLGRKSALGMTSGIFMGSTPDLNSWHYRPNQRIAGSFVNFAGGGEDFRYSSTLGLGVNTIGWKVDRPFAFFENEASYKDKVSVYHSLIADTLRGLSTNGMRLPAGISHSYFTAHYKPFQAVSFDLYHNYFRDVPSATTTIVGTGLVDQLLFQGISGGVHIKPTRNITFYTTLGASEKTGDSHRSLNQAYGASWSEIARTGIRADFHYSKFDSNFGKGNYQVLSLSRQVTNRAFWNLQVGKQDLLSQFTTNHNSTYITDSIDFNVGRRSYLQSGYTYVNGATLNYRQWYFSWGFRLGKVNSRPEYAQSVGAVH